MPLHHVCVYAKDIDRSIAFYKEAFGAEIAAEWDNVVQENGRSFEGRGVFLELGSGTFVEIFPADQSAEALEFPVVAANHFCIFSSDCEKDFAKAVKAGAKAYLPTRAKDNGMDWDGGPIRMKHGGSNGADICIAYMKGPDGEIIELFETKADSLRPKNLRKNIAGCGMAGLKND